MDNVTFNIENNSISNEILRISGFKYDIKGDVHITLTTPDGREFTFYWQPGMEPFKLRFEEMKPNSPTP